MPTIKQLNESMSADLLGFTAQNSHGPEHDDYVPSPSSSFRENFKGEVIGEIVFNPKSEGLKIIVKPQ